MLRSASYTRGQGRTLADREPDVDDAPYTEDLKPFVEAMLNKRVVVKLHVTKTVTWDHRKLGLPSM